MQLGGHPVAVRDEEIGVDRREPVEDVTRILSGYHALIGARVFEHSILERMAAVATVPVVNMLSGHSHPLQALADALTMQQALGSIAGKVVAWIGDYTNVARSLGEICARLDAHVRFACPQGYGPDDAELQRLQLLGTAGVTSEPTAEQAVDGAHAVHSDTWVSMGDEIQADTRRRAFEGFTVTGELMRRAAANAVFLHCLPANPRPGGRRRRHRRPTQPGHRPGAQPDAHGSGLADVPVAARPDGRPLTNKVRRQAAIARLVSHREVANQARLVELLAAEGIHATQATVSRDLDDLGAVKVRAPGGTTAYALPELEPDRLAPLDQLRRVMGDWVADISWSGNLVVMRTPPGCAHVVGSALDRSGLDGLLGTVAGDDTLLCVADEDTTGRALAADLAHLAGRA